MIFAVNVVGDEVGNGLGRARAMAVAEVESGRILSWVETGVGWDALHDTGTHGSHHARIVRFLKENKVEAVITGHAGPPMVRTLELMGLACVLGASGNAREATLTTYAMITNS